MRFVVFFLLIILFSCKRNNTSVLVNTIDNETGLPASNIKIKVYRKGKENMFIDKEPLVVAEGVTNGSGKNVLNFKYDRGNKYSVEVFQGNNYWGNSIDLWTDLEKGKNEATFYLYRYCFLKLNLKSQLPTLKSLFLDFEDMSNGYVFQKSYHNTIYPIDTTILRLFSVLGGTKTLNCKIDSNGIKLDYSLPIELINNDTAYATVNF